MKARLTFVVKTFLFNFLDHSVGGGGGGAPQHYPKTVGNR